MLSSSAARLPLLIHPRTRCRSVIPSIMFMNYDEKRRSISSTPNPESIKFSKSFVPTITAPSTTLIGGILRPPVLTKYSYVSPHIMYSTSRASPSSLSFNHLNDQDNGGDDRGGLSNGVKLYIGNLAYSTDEHHLRGIFGEFGVVTDVNIPVERGTDRPRGFGFVTLDSREAAERAIAAMDQTEMDGRLIRVNESKPRERREYHGSKEREFNVAGLMDVKLYVGNLSFDTDENTIKNLFSSFGPVLDFFRPSDRETGQVRGFAFVTMAAAEAEKASHNLDGEEIDGRLIRVNEAKPKDKSGAGGSRRYNKGPGYGSGGRGGYNDGPGYDNDGDYNGGERKEGYDDRGGYGGGY